MAWPLGAGRLTGIAPTTIQADVRRRRPPASRQPQRFGDSRLDESVLAVWQAVNGSIPVSRTRVDRQGGTEARRPAKRLGRRVGVADYANGEPALVAMILRAITVNDTKEEFEMSENVDPVATPSRIVEYFPPGPTVSASDCLYGGNRYSKGAVLTQGDGALHSCSGDKDGTWVKVAQDKK